MTRLLTQTDSAGVQRANVFLIHLKSVVKIAFTSWFLFLQPATYEKYQCYRFR